MYEWGSPCMARPHSVSRNHEGSKVTNLLYLGNCYRYHHEWITEQQAGLHAMSQTLPLGTEPGWPPWDDYGMTTPCSAYYNYIQTYQWKWRSCSTLFVCSRQPYALLSDKVHQPLLSMWAVWHFGASDPTSRTCSGHCLHGIPYQVG